MISQQLIDSLLKEFFVEQVNSGLQNRFFECLHDDFNEVIESFKDFVTKQSLQNKNMPVMNVHQSIPPLVLELCAMKIACIKHHTKVLVDAAEEAIKQEKRLIH